ncbi:tetratricopeptide repeat protein [Pseudaestuariivita atlantica]|uniref:Uncharacterized protein n=1 Tax=Pseudaestuariivita atlantica TaxID=1317121 RepID=A0A0L1JTJ1_9RHOB|nr:tetratricopeptide repeat protein [Pseudaestuariivita atlantica]KNG95081.1 hypothetical protein ATO11_00010 [Pseudaestuariivita atlantica]
MTTPSALEKWKAQLGDDGKAALRVLLNGTASLGRLSAAEPEDAVDAILASEARDSDIVSGFDRGCTELLEEFRLTLLQQEGRSFRIELAKLVTLVTIIRRLLPEQMVVDLHRRYVLWSGFFENFVVDRGLDLRREYFRILALSQDVAADHGLEPRRLMSLWLSVCAESGDAGRYDASYLRVALLGLRRLPLGDDFDANEDFTLQGLARWAVTQRPTTAAFEREWRILEGDFPRDAGFWGDRVQMAVTAAERELAERTNGAETTFPIARWWREDVDIHPNENRLRGGSAHEPPPREAREAILRDIGRALPQLSDRIDTLMKGHKRYADCTGDVFHLVRSSCNIGMRLLEKGSSEERVDRGRLSVSLAALAFEYDPLNAHAWSLMMRALRTAGRVQDAELVGWEALRRFPENVQWRTQLASLLAGGGAKPDEAIALLKEAQQLFPENAFVRTQLAEIVAEDRGGAQEAVKLLQETISLFPGNPYARNQLAMVLADDLKRADEARDILNGAIAEGAADDVTRSLLQKLDQGRVLRRAKPKAVVVEDASTLMLPTAMARRQLFLFEAGLSSADSLRAFLADTPQDSYATYVSERAGLTDVPFKTTFATAFEDALEKAEPSAMRALIARARPMERAIVEEAFAVSEGRVVAFSEFFADAEGDERLQTLERTLGQEGGRADRRTLLLRDFAASTLSTSVVSLVAA